MPRSVARTAAIAALTVSSGALVAVPPAVADIGADMRFVCAGEAGTHKVGLRIESSTPSAGSVGEPVQLGTIKVDVGLPAELVDEVRAKSAGAAPAEPATGVTPSSEAPPGVEGVAQVVVGVRDGDGVRRGGWPAFALAAVPSGGDGITHLTGSGVAPPVVPRSAGGLSWVAGGLDLSLVPGDAAASKDAAGLSLHCAADTGTVLGSVRVRRDIQALPPGAQSASPRQAAAPQENLCEEIPPPGLDPRYDINPDPALMKIYDEPGVPKELKKVTDEGNPYCIKATGFVNIKKAGNAVPLAAESLMRRGTVAFTPPNEPGYSGPNYTEQRGYVVNGTYPIPGTVLGFGFMPTRAMAEAVQTGAPGAGKNDPITGNVQISLASNPFLPLNYIDHGSAEVASYVRLKASLAEINGVPIDLGDNCKTSHALLSANAFLGNGETGLLDPTVGETLIAENLKIPHFAGCGVTEDLSPLLTASISGTGNYVKVEAGSWCRPDIGTGCVDDAGPQPETWTIKPGGDVVAVAEPFVLTDLFRRNHVTCKSATMRFHLDAQHWRARFMLAKAGLSFEDCEIQTRTAVYPAHFTQEGSVWLNGTAIGADGTVALDATNLRFKVDTEVNGSPCTLRFNAISAFDRSYELPSTIKLSYDNATGVATGSIRNNFSVSLRSTCSNAVGFTKGQFLGPSTVNFALQPRQEITAP